MFEKPTHCVNQLAAIAFADGRHQPLFLIWLKKKAESHTAVAKFIQKDLRPLTPVKWSWVRYATLSTAKIR